MAIHPITKLSLLSGGPTSSVRGCKALIPCCWRAAHKRRTVSQPARLSGARKSTSGARRGIHRRSAQPDFRAAQDDVVGEPLAADFLHAIFIARSPATESDGFHTIKRRRTAAQIAFVCERQRSASGKNLAVDGKNDRPLRDYLLNHRH